MILTVTLNPAVDKTYTVENFRIDRVHRPASCRVVPGGKGINVARVYKELGGESFLTGFLGGHNGDYILDGTQAEFMPSEFVRTAGESRVCIAVVDPLQKTQTELNEPGPEVNCQEIERLKDRFASLVPGMEFAVLSGSTPPGAPDSIYRELVDIARRNGVRCVLDASGAPLAQGLEAVPCMVKPNVHELSGVLGRQIATVDEAVAAAMEIRGRGVEVVVVTFGRDGAVAVSSEGVVRARPPEIPFVSAVGSGDALAAGFIFALSQGGSVADALRLGTGAGSANAMTSGAGFCCRDEILRLADETGITELPQVAL